MAHGWLSAAGEALLGVALTLAAQAVPPRPQGPAGVDRGIFGLLGAGAIRAVAGRLPEAAQFWDPGRAWLPAGSPARAGRRVLAFDWARL